MAQETPDQMDQRAEAFVGIVRDIDVREVSSITLDSVAGPRSFLVRFPDAPAGRLLVAAAGDRWKRTRRPVFVIVDGATLRLNDDATSMKAELVAAA